MLCFSNRLKKAVAVIAAVAIVGVPAFAAEVTSASADGDFRNAEFVLEALDISQRGKNPDENVSRGLATAVITHTLFERTSASENRFNDISDSIYAKEINQAADIGIVGGYGDGTFLPDREAEVDEILSILVSALGYKSGAIELGGYPSGYNVLASRFKLLKGVYANVGSNPITYRDFAVMMTNFLDATPLETVSYGTDPEFKKSDRTILDDILSRKKLKIVKGVMNYYEAEGDGRYTVGIDNASYEDNGVADSSYLGYTVTAFVTDEDRSILTAVQDDSRKNDTLEIMREDLISVSNKAITYSSNNKKREINFSNPPTVIKGGSVLSVQTDADLEPINGKIILIDNDSDNAYEYIRVVSKEYFEVERTSADNNVIFLKNEKYSGSSLIYINPEDSARRHTLKNSAGEDIAFSDIKSGDYIAVSGSKDRNSMEITVLDTPKTGKVNRIGGFDRDGVEIDGEFYLYSGKSDGSLRVSDSDLKLGKEMEFVTDGGFLVSAKEKKAKDEYGFVIAAKRGGAFSDEVQYKILAEDNKIYTGRLADRVKFNGKNTNSEDVNFKTNIPVKYTVDENGDISSVEECEQYGEKENRRWNEDTSIFTSLRYNYPLFIDENTKVYVVPDSREDDDYRANLKLVNGEKYIVAAYDYDEDTYLTGAVVIYRDIAYDTPGVITKDSMPVILKDKRSILDEEENIVYNLTFLEGNEERSYNVKNNTAMNSTVNKMSTGDVFRYSLNSIDLVDNIEILLDADEKEFFHRGANTSTETVFGEVLDGVSRTLPKGSAGHFANILKLAADNGSVKNFIIYSSKDIYYYLYDADRKTVRSAGFDDIMTDNVPSDIKASYVYIYFYENEAKCVTIVKGGGN